MGILAFGDTNIGMKRKTNQDSIKLDHDKNFFMVADGMGGHNGGDIASQLSVKLMPEFLEKNTELDLSTLLSKGIAEVNQGIFDYGKNNAELKGMGTTVTCIMIDETTAYIGNVGDSRTYLISNNKLYQLTRDHSLVQEKINLGFYDREGGRNDPQKNVLIRTVGFEENIEVDVYKYKIQKGDLFLLCSDGLHGKVSDSDMLYILNRDINNQKELTLKCLETAVSHLIDLANKNGGQDNISVIIAAVPRS